MSVMADRASKVLRAQRFNRADVFHLLYGEHGYDYTVADAQQAAHRLKAWKSLRERFSKRVREEGVERITQRIRERVPRQFWSFVEYLPARWNPLDPLRVTRWDWEAWHRRAGIEPTPELLEELLRILGELVQEFLAELEQTGKFEIPAPVISVQPGAGLAAGLEVSDVGRSVAVELVVGAGLTRTRQSLQLAAPVVVERVAVWVDAAIAVVGGRVQVIVTPAGATYGATATADQVTGVPLMEGVDDLLVPVRSVSLVAVRTFAEFWPRRVVPAGPVRITVTVVNSDIATRTFVIGVDGRDVVRTA